MRADGRTQRGEPAGDAVVERSDTPAGRVAVALAALVGALLLVCAAVAGLLIWFDRDAGPQAPPMPAALTPPEPRLQVAEPLQRHRLEAAGTAGLRAHGRSGGIEAAMRRVAARGWAATEDAR